MTDYRQFWNDVLRDVHEATVALPKLEPITEFPRELNPDAWPPMACGCRVECRCEEGEKR